MNVTLTWDELEVAVFTGCRRQMNAAKLGLQEKGQRGRARLRNQQWTEHILGASGEMAFAKARNVFFDHSLTSWKKADVAGVQVRTRSVTNGALIVQPDARDDDWYVLVVPVELPCAFRIVGYIRARDARREEWLKNPNNFAPAYFVPQSALKPLPEPSRG